MPSEDKIVAAAGNWAAAMPETVLRPIVRSVVEALYASGLIADADLADEATLTAKVTQRLGALRGRIAGALGKEVTEIADRMEKEGQYELALMLYALLHEHIVNLVIQRVLAKRETALEVRKEVIGNASLEGKTTWLLALLGLPPIAGPNRETIKLVAQERDDFVHSQWYFAGDPGEAVAERERMQELVAKARKTVTYLRQYEARVQNLGGMRKMGKMGRLREMRKGMEGGLETASEQGRGGTEGERTGQQIELGLQEDTANIGAWITRRLRGE